MAKGMMDHERWHEYERRNLWKGGTKVLYKEKRRTYKYIDEKNKLVMGVGTGLGVCALIYNEGEYVSCP